MPASFSAGKAEFVAQHRSEYAALRERNSLRRSKAERHPYAALDAHRPGIDWSAYTPPRPSFLGTRVFDDYPVEELIPYIDWTPFFVSWDLAGKYPAILQDETVGEAARQLFEDAQQMLSRIVSEKRFTARAVVGFWPANQVNRDDIALFADESRHHPFTTLHHLRQQTAKAGGEPNYCLSDFVAPLDSGIPDYVGGFVVTAGLGCDELVRELEAANDVYGSIMVKALADRLAEAFAERMHERVRKEFWGYAGDEALDNDALIRERYRGIRPAPGYPACPDHTEKRSLFALLDAEQRIGVRLTESCAMWPAASVSGWYFAHPEAKYFNVGKIARDQVESLAGRKGMGLKELERWLGPNLDYDPA